MKGFTLIELLIVIAILAVLATTVAVVLNPAQMLKEARDSQRMSDLKAVQSAIALYLASVTSPTFSTSTIYCTNGTTAETSGDCTAKAVYKVDGTGWVAVNLASIPSGSPLAALPKDPTNSGGLCYAAALDTTNLTFELVTHMESTKYANTGTSDVESTDGGDNDDYYEIGSDPDLDLI